MTRTLPRIFANVLSRPYKHALRFYDLDRRRIVIEVQTHAALPDLVEGLLLDLSEFHSDICERVAAVDDKRFMASPHKSRRYIARERELLYIASPQLTDKHSRQVGDHWMITNIGKTETYAFLSAIEQAAGVKRERFADLKL